MNGLVASNVPTAASARKVDELLAHYGQSHKNPSNEVIHFIAIPLIMISLVGLIFALHPYLAYAFVAASLAYYARLSLVFLGVMTVLTALTLALLHSLGIFLFPLCISVFIVAWIMQSIGHQIEGKKPSFLEDIQYLWVGPLFVLSKLFIKFGRSW